MIEIELKFKIDSIPKGVQGLRLVKTSEGQDLYYDTQDLRLISKGNFLRSRNNDVVDFKLDIGNDSHFVCKETSFKISDIKSDNNDLVDLLASLELGVNDPFDNFEGLVGNLRLIAPIIKKRSVYEADNNLSITIDDVEGLGLFMEAEVMVEDDHASDNFNEIRDNITKTLKEKNILNDKCIPVSIGYVELYLMEHDRPTYEAGKFKA